MQLFTLPLIKMMKVRVILQELELLQLFLLLNNDTKHAGDNKTQHLTVEMEMTEENEFL